MVRVTRILYPAILVFLLTASPAFAAGDGDWQFWNTDGVEKKLGPKWKADIEEEFRFSGDDHGLNYTHTEGGLTYKATDWLDLGAKYRQIFEKEKGKWIYESMPAGVVTLKWKPYGFDISDRNRLEYRMPQGKDDKWRYRNKLTMYLPVELTSLKIRPFVADEIFIDMAGAGFYRNRFYSGFEAKLGPHLKTEIFYLWQTTEKNSSWIDYNVIGLKLKAVF